MGRELPPFYSNVASIGLSIVDYNRSCFPWKPQCIRLFKEFVMQKKQKIDQEIALF